MSKSFLLFLLLFPVIIYAQNTKGGEDAKGIFKYEDFQKPQECGASCHIDFFAQWKQMMMSKCYTHEWDEIEYFKLAIPHAEKEPKVAGVKEGCNGCHAPASFMSGDVPPPKPEFNSRANESVSCDVCHTVTGFVGDTPYNFNFISNPGRTKYGNRGNLNSPAHETVKNPLLSKSEFCGACHNEKSPFGAWVKATHLEWKDGPYSKEGVQCQNCHMPRTPGKSSTMGVYRQDIAQHLFHGAHDPGKVRGTVELRIHSDSDEIVPGETARFTVILFNQKTGHKFPTGSAEERMLWLHVEATDANGKVYHLKVDRKGFEGEDYTIASSVLAYQDMGVPLGIPDFKGVPRDGVSEGDRIFRLPYLDPLGRMTIQQWNTASFGPDYRLGPRETKTETFTWTPPDEIADGKLTVKAYLYYQKLPAPVAEYLGVPKEEAEIIEVNNHTTIVMIVED
ncbi:MAG: NapC/NirT family cytochrome c [Ignavibacteria bacterium]|nr:NapC/NirT family cytochrome c [Ignavibacteria bacterium]